MAWHFTGLCGLIASIKLTMKQVITGFNQDDCGDWVAELSCGHARHVRHNPPWQDRVWVTTEQGRQKMIGVEIECGLCERSAKNK